MKRIVCFAAGLIVVAGLSGCGSREAGVIDGLEDNPYQSTPEQQAELDSKRASDRDLMKANDGS